MSAHPPEHDWQPQLPLARLSPAARAAAGSVVLELQSQLIEWRLLADRTSNPTLRDALYRNVSGWRAVLDAHQPNLAGRCPRCRGRWGRSPTWPCTQFADVASALRRPLPTTP